MMPVRTADCNRIYRGPPEVHDLPCKVDGAETASTWELTSEEMEQIYKEGARIRITIFGHPIPPVRMEVVPVEGPMRRVKAPCDICGGEVDDAQHLTTGPDCHAFRYREG